MTPDELTELWSQIAPICVKRDEQGLTLVGEWPVVTALSKDLIQDASRRGGDSTGLFLYPSGQMIVRMGDGDCALYECLDWDSHLSHRAGALLFRKADPLEAFDLKL